MSDNDKKVPKVRQSPEIRKQFILDHIAQLTQTEIANDMGVSRMQISRDIKAMKESGEWTEWLENELIRLHLEAEIDDITKYREIAKLYARTLVQRREIDTNVDMNVTFKAWRPNMEDEEEEEPEPVDGDDDEDDPDQLLSP